MTFIERVLLWILVVHMIASVFLKNTPETVAANLQSWWTALLG